MWFHRFRMDVDGHTGKNEKYFGLVSDRLLSFQRSGLFCDTALVARDQKLIYAHSSILASVCISLASRLNQQPFFKPMPNVIDLTQFCADIIEQLIVCIYTGRFTDNQSAELQKLCDHLGITVATVGECDGNFESTDDAVLSLKVEEFWDGEDRELTISECTFGISCDSDGNLPDSLSIFQHPEVAAADKRNHSSRRTTTVESESANSASAKKSSVAVASSGIRRRLPRDVDSRPYVCAECHRSFRSPVRLKIHAHSAHTVYKNVKPFRCRLCNRPFATYDTFQKHVDSHTWHVDNKSNLMCGYCRKIFKYRESLMSHIHVHEMNGDEITATVADSSAATGKVQFGFPKRKPPRKDHICPMCGKGFRGPSRLRVHISRHTGDAPHVCNICGKGFANAEYIKKHQRIHSGNRGHQCTICDKSFFSPSSLLCHMNRHTGEKPYSCEVCGRGFSQVSSIIKHRKTHLANANPGHLCQFCGKQFASFVSHMMHMRKHTGDMPFACEECGRRFMRAHDLQLHQFEHSRHFPYVCCECNRGFGTGSKLKRHILAVHTPDEEKPFKCLYCSKGFAENYLLKQHWRCHFKTV